MQARIDEILALLDATSHDIEERRQVAGALHPPAPTGVSVQAVEAGTVRGELVEVAGRDPRGTVLLVHGGGYVAGSPAIVQGFAGRLALAAGVSVFSVQYRLAPEHRCPAAVEDVAEAYRWLGERSSSPVVVGGQSAGGGIALAAVLLAAARGLSRPAAVFALSPSTDMTLASPSLTDESIDDPLLRDLGPMQRNRAAYLGDLDPASPLASPLFGDLADLPPVHIEVSATERMVDDARRLATAARAAGVPVALVETSGALHNFPNLAGDTPEGVAALDRIAAFVDGALSG